MDKEEIEKKLNKFFGQAEEKKMEEKKIEVEETKPSITVDVIDGTMSDPRMDNDGVAIDKVVKYGTLNDGTQYGKKVILIDSLTKDNNQIFWIYQKVGRVFINDNITTGKEYHFNGVIDGGEFEQTPKVVFAYKKINEKDNSEFYSLSILPKN